MTLGERIEVALEIADMSVKDLERALEGTDGASYANLHRLKSDKKTRPSADLLHALADATGVDPHWLVTGEGEATQARERAREEVVQASSPGSSPIVDGFQRGVMFGFGLGADSAPRPWRGPLAEVVRRFRRAEPTFPLDAPRTEALDVGRALRAPLDALRIDADRMGNDALDAYILTMVPALLALASEPRVVSAEERLRRARDELSQARADDESSIVEILKEEVRRLERRVEEQDENPTQEEEA